MVEFAYKDHNRMALTTHHCLFRFTRMPSGLKNDSGTFKRSMDVLLTKVTWQFALV